MLTCVAITSLELLAAAELGKCETTARSNCVAIAGICGSTCESGVYEPSYFTPGTPGYLDKAKSMHCVRADEPARALSKMRTTSLCARCIPHT